MMFHEERRLLSIGFPLEDALALCNSMRRDDGELETFVNKQESLFHQRMEQLKRMEG